MTKTIIKEKTIEECLQSLSQEEINRLYQETPEELKPKKKKITNQDKIDTIVERIGAEFIALSFIFSDDDIKQLADLSNDKKIRNINPNFLTHNFIFNIDNNYIMPTEIKELCKAIIEKDMQSQKKDVVLHFYLIANGVLTITKLIELIKDTGINITKDEIITRAQKFECIIENNLIYLDEFSKDIDEQINMHKQKEENTYKVFNLQEIFALQFQLEDENYEKRISKSLSKKVKNKDKLKYLTSIIRTMATVGYSYQENIETLLNDEDVKLTEEETEKLFEIVDDIHLYYPVWELNGYSEAEILGIDDNEDDDEIPFEELSLDEQIDAYINIYLCLNGVIEIDKLLEILTANHNIEITKKELIQKASNIEDMIINGNYICIAGGEELIEEITPIKNTLKQYKIVEDIDKEVDEFWHTGDRIAEVLLKHEIDGNISIGLFQLMQMGGIPEEMLDEILKEEGYNLSSKKIKEITKELSIIQKDVRIWCFNGFKKAELTNLNKKEKIGRNDLCPCGSGKKYKKCCGK